jgi:hypothetical protein
MTWKADRQNDEVTTPWGETVTVDGLSHIPDDVQAKAEEMFRGESMAELSTDRIADYAQAWMGDVEVVRP